MQIKINRAFVKAEIGKCPASRVAMLVHVPEELRATLTSTQLALMLDALWVCAQKSKSIAARDIIDEGCVWDDKSKRLIALQH